MPDQTVSVDIKVGADISNAQAAFQRLQQAMQGLSAGGGGAPAAAGGGGAVAGGQAGPGVGGNAGAALAGVQGGGGGYAGVGGGGGGANPFGGSGVFMRLAAASMSVRYMGQMANVFGQAIGGGGYNPISYLQPALGLAGQVLGSSFGPFGKVVGGLMGQGMGSFLGQFFTSHRSFAETANSMMQFGGTEDFYKGILGRMGGGQYLGVNNPLGPGANDVIRRLFSEYETSRLGGNQWINSPLGMRPESMLSQLNQYRKATPDILQAAYQWLGTPTLDYGASRFSAMRRGMAWRQAYEEAGPEAALSMYNMERPGDPMGVKNIQMFAGRYNHAKGLFDLGGTSSTYTASQVGYASALTGAGSSGLLTALQGQISSLTANITNARALMVFYNQSQPEYWQTRSAISAYGAQQQAARNELLRQKYTDPGLMNKVEGLEFINQTMQTDPGTGGYVPLGLIRSERSSAMALLAKQQGNLTALQKATNPNQELIEQAAETVRGTQGQIIALTRQERYGNLGPLLQMMVGGGTMGRLVHPAYAQAGAAQPYSPPSVGGRYHGGGAFGGRQDFAFHFQFANVPPGVGAPTTKNFINGDPTTAAMPKPGQKR